jgi:allantoinase
MVVKKELAVRSKRIFSAKGTVRGHLIIGEGKILDITGYDENPGCEVLEAGNDIVMPGIIDPHVHINEPGRTEWEGFESATRSAAAGGITTITDMPLNSSPVTVNKNSFQLKLAAANQKLNVNCSFWGGVIPGNFPEIRRLLESGVFGLKAFLTHSGIDEFPASTAEELIPVLQLLKEFNMPLLVHCELDEAHSEEQLFEQNPCSYSAYLHSRPREWENNAIALMIDLCRMTQAHIHIVHLSSAGAIPMIRKAKHEGLPLTVETAPHYLFFSSENIPDKATHYKCAPPIREKENNDKLWEALKDGTIDFIATDHSPAPPELKEMESGNFKKAWGGIAGLQFSLSAIWSKAREKNIPAENITRWMCENPALLLGIEKRKGYLQKGFDADICIWNPDEKFKADFKDIHHRHKLTPYAGLELYGKVNHTFVNGKLVYSGGKFIHLHKGELLFHKASTLIN